MPSMLIIAVSPPILWKDILFSLMLVHNSGC